MRFVVERLDGDLRPRSPGRATNASFHVIDTKVNYRLMATYRTEDYLGGTSAHAHELAERFAHEHAARLNAR